MGAESKPPPGYVYTLPMKKEKAWFLLLVYLGVNISGVFPLVHDFLAHTFWHDHHMHHVHHHDHGHHHVEIEIAAFFKQNDQKTHITERTGDKQFSVHLSYEGLMSLKIIVLTQYTSIAGSTSIFTDISQEILAPPPRLV